MQVNRIKKGAGNQRMATVCDLILYPRKNNTAGASNTIIIASFLFLSILVACFGVTTSIRHAEFLVHVD